MIRVTDYIANYVYSMGVETVFMVTGGGMMFLSDGIAKHPKLKSICNHHEQASAMSAVSYSKYSENFGVAYVTTGCGGTNSMTGLLGAWQDNIPCLFVSGQSKRKETVRNSGLKLRKFGVQEADIIALVEPITKYSIMINDPKEIAYHLDKAIHLAKSGCPGPVWIDVPLDIQGSLVDESKMKRYTYEVEKRDYKENPSEDEVNQILDLVTNAKRPVILAGQGIRLSKSIPEFKEFIERAQIPVVSSVLGVGILPSDHPFYIGKVGTKGSRAGNMAMQNSDLLISLGSSLSVSTTGHEYELFAREAKVVVIDINNIEHKKNTVKIDHFINADIKKVLQKLERIQSSSDNFWREKCLHWKNKYPVCLPEYGEEKDGINLYYFVNRLSNWIKDKTTVVSDAGSAFYVTSQAIQLNENQRFITSGAQAEMGYTIPATIGIAAAEGSGEVVGITGDGSFQMNIQELQTIIHNQLPIKLFVWNNDGYLSIRASQRKFFEGRFIGTDKTSGVSFPDLKKIADAYGLKYYKLSDSKTLDDQLKDILSYSGPVLSEVMCIRDQEIVPSVASHKKADGSMVSKPLEDMYPFLDRDEFYSEMIVKPLDE
jgi:acetolactate synthase I/II/III large subunit